MAREIVLFKDHPETLRQVSQEVTEFGTALVYAIDNMTYVMRSCHKAIGIAAIQVNEPLRLGILELNYDKKNVGKPFVMVNPQVISSGGLVLNNESCLSLPGQVVKKHRADLLKLRYQTVEGKWEEQTFRGLWARCVAHEIDHMNGKLIIDK